MKIAITGATGLLGRKLMVKLLEENHEVIAICRTKKHVTELPENKVFEWDALSGEFPANALTGVQAIVHLAGDPVADGRWTKEKKKRIYDSRVVGTRKLIDALAKIPKEQRPSTLISGSAIGIYGDQGDVSLNENSKSGEGFLAEVVVAWEKESMRASELGMRLVHLRTGIVLSRQGGALPKMAPVTLGDGKQWMSWIHVADWENFVTEAIKDKTFAGDYNLTAPHPVTNAEFTKALRSAICFPVPAQVPKIFITGALGEMGSAVLASQRVFPKRALEQGFKFRFTDIDAALANLYKDQSYLESKLEVWQFVPAQIDEVFPFFSAAENLEKITPPWLKFKIEKKSTPEVEENTVIDYKLKIHGFPARWKSKIVDWKPGVQFVDYQLKGPYAKWHHTHTFKKVQGGTLLGDHVIYRIPGSFLGKTVLGQFIKHDVSTIFKYRQKVIHEMFGKK
jgi:uncharacterized protein (TIGR01777 family)